MEKGAVYYFTQAGIERGLRRETEQEAEADIFAVMQRHNPRVTIRKAVVGVRGSTVVSEHYANCARL